MEPPSTLAGAKDLQGATCQPLGTLADAKREEGGQQDHQAP